MSEEGSTMKDQVKHKRTGLTVHVNTNFKVPGNANHRQVHLNAVDAEFSRVLGAALSHPSNNVAEIVLTLLEINLRTLKELARMDEDEVKEEILKNPQAMHVLEQRLAEVLLGDFSHLGRSCP